MLPDKPLRDFTLADIQRLVTDQEPENDRIEYKQSLSSRDTQGDPWLRGEGKIGQLAKDRINSELVALANSHGGYLFLGIAETDDKPPRASTLTPLPNCAALAERLAQAAGDCIDPKLPQLDCIHIKTDPNGNGIIAFHVLRSAIGPHRLATDRECYVRRNERCERITMREIQDLAIRTHRQAEEGLWTAMFGHPTATRNGGVVVLEAGRLFGGDSSHYYEGRYEVLNETVRAEFRVVHYFGDPVSAFGDRSPRFTVHMAGTRQGEKIAGTLSRHDVPGIKPQLILQRRANLP